MRNCILVILVSNALTLHGQELERESTIPSINFWTMSSELLINFKLQSRLQVTSAQLKSVDQLRGSEKFEKLFAKGRQDLKFPPLEIVNEDDLLYMHFDTEVRNALAEVLSDSQLIDLKQAYLRVRFPRGLDPFGNLEIRASFLLATEDDRQRFLKCYEKYKLDYEKTLSHLRNTTAASVVSELPSGCKIFFVQIVGNKYLPNFPAFPADPYNAIPFKEGLMVFSLSSIVPDSMIATKLALSPDQISKIQEVARKVDEILHNEEKLFQGGNKRYLHAVDASQREVLKVLHNDQAVVFARENMQLRFEMSPISVLSNVKVQKYLGLSVEDAIELMSIASKEERNLVLEQGNLNRRVFEGICDSLPLGAQTRMKKLFKEVW